MILSCNGLQIEVAHLQRGSVRVKVGQNIHLGDGLGLVGNSGNTSEPHLHIHAVDPQTNEGVPITFDGRYPVRNSLFRFNPQPSESGRQEFHPRSCRARPSLTSGKSKFLPSLHHRWRNHTVRSGNIAHFLL